MSKNPTMEDVIRQSLIAELDAEALYKHAESITKNGRTRNIFTQLARDEAGHFGILRKRYLAMKVAGAEEIKKVVDDKPPSDALKRLEAHLDKDTSERKALEIAMGEEQRAVERYELGVKLADDAQVKKMFEKLVSDEKGHFAILSEEFSIISGQPISAEAETYVRE